MFFLTVLATTFFFSDPRESISSPPSDSARGFAIQLGIGPTYGGGADEDGDIDVNNTIKGFEVSGGFVSASPARSLFVDVQCGYSPKMDYFNYDLSVLRFRFMLGPKLRVGSVSSFRAGLGLGFTKAMTDESGGFAPSLHAMIGCFFPLDDYIGGFSLNYSRTLGNLTLSQRTEYMPGGQRATYRHSIRLHDLAFKFDWHIPIALGSAKPRQQETLRP